MLHIVAAICSMHAKAYFVPVIAVFRSTRGILVDSHQSIITARALSSNHKISPVSKILRDNDMSAIIDAS